MTKSDDAIATKKRSGPSIPNEQRARPLITITMSRDAVADLDARRGEMSRGEFIEELLRRSQLGR